MATDFGSGGRGQLWEARGSWVGVPGVIPTEIAGGSCCATREAGKKGLTRGLGWSDTARGARALAERGSGADKRARLVSRRGRATRAERRGGRGEKPTGPKAGCWCGALAGPRGWKQTGPRGEGEGGSGLGRFVGFWAGFFSFSYFYF